MKVPHDVVQANVATALREDLGSGDVHASLVASDSPQRGIIISRSNGVFCGRQWVEETYRQVCDTASVKWECDEGGTIAPDQNLATITGPGSVLLTAERTALNFLQLLSATATRTRHFTKLIEHTSARILDTRKTLPGLRDAQKHAVRVGGGVNHRMGLFDAILLKENHIAACGGLEPAITRAREQHPTMFLEVEVDSLDQFDQAMRFDVDRIMLDNFSLAQIREAVRMASNYLRIGSNPVELEASGGIDESNIVQIAETGVDYVSLGTLTKDVTAVDLSFKVID